MMKRRKAKFLLAISLVGCMAIYIPLLAEVNLQTLLPFRSHPDKEIKDKPVYEAPDSVSDLPIYSTLSENSPRRVAKPANALLYEDFESTTGESLPGGWTTLPTPGHSESKWISASLSYSNGDPFPGTSGHRYAFVAGQAYSIDTWMFTPKMHLVKGSTYDVFFNCFKPRPDRGGLPAIHAYITTDTSGSPESIVAELVEREDAINSWEIIGRDFTPATTGDYYLAFENRVAVNGNYICIDDVYVTESTPRYYSQSYLVLPDKTDAVESSSDLLTIYNIGSSELDVNVIETTPGLATDALNYTVIPGGRIALLVTVTSTTPGEYKGYITLRTNDPIMECVVIEVTCNIIKTHTTDYIFEDFEDGAPLGWGLNNFHFRNSDGVNNSRCLEAWSLYEPSVTTNIVEMGENPIVAFSYKATEYDITGTQSYKEPKEGEYVKFTLEVSDDGGNTWNKVYRVAPDGDKKHETTSEFTRIEIPLPEYAGKSCLICLSCDMCTALFVDDFGILIDDWEMGTRPGIDLAVSQLNTDGILPVGQKAEISLTVRNTSTVDIAGKNYKVTLIDGDNNTLASADGSDLAAHEEKTFSLHFTPSTTGSLSIAGKVVFAADTKPENDLTGVRNLIVIDDATSNIVTPPTDDIELYYGFESPIDFYNRFNATQTIYPVTEMKATDGIIRGVRYFFSNDAPFVTPEIQIYIGETDKFNFSDNKFVDPSGLTKVFSGSISLPKGETHFDIPFDEAYEWKGGNIVIFTWMNSASNYWNKLFIMSDDAKFKARTINNVAGVQISDLSELKEGVAANVTSIAEFFIDVNEEVGTVAGTITDDKGGITNAYIGYEGSSNFTTTDENGCYRLENVPVGDHKMIVKAFAHFDHTADLTVVKGETASLNAKLKVYPSHDMTFTVVDADKKPLSNVYVSVNGFENLKARTSADGTATLKIYDGQDYTYSVRDYGRISAFGKVSDKETAKEIALKKDLMPVSYLKTSVADNELIITWESPKDYFRYDNGKCEGAIGYNLGTYTSAMGCAFHNVADIEEVEWYTNSEYQPHPNIYLYLFELDKNGRPDGIPVFAYRDVPNVEGQWNSFKLHESLHSDNGFFVGVACDAGSIGLGVSKLRDDLNLQPAWFWTSIDFTYEPMNSEEIGLWVDNYGTVNGDCVPMIRATGTNHGFVDYADYSPRIVDWTDGDALVRKSRKMEETPLYRVEIDGKKVADNLSATSLVVPGLTHGTHSVSVYAVYPDGCSIAKTAIVDTTSGISDLVLEDEVSVLTERGAIQIIGADKVASYRIIDLSGKVLKSAPLTDDVIPVNDLVKGLKLLQLQLVDGNIRTLKISI